MDLQYVDLKSDWTFSSFDQLTLNLEPLFFISVYEKVLHLLV